MKLVLLTLLFTSCAIKPSAPCNCAKKPKEMSQASKMHICMKEFSKDGYDSDAIVKICSKIHERRN